MYACSRSVLYFRGKKKIPYQFQSVNLHNKISPAYLRCRASDIT